MEAHVEAKVKYLLKSWGFSGKVISLFIGKYLHFYYQAA